ncbi:hypothetical protein [Gelidibacter maritimus]|uniref:SH3 domain-containing protein n=1 Tax=Gelidibacter maritimus TaxID=2761487 RepID=A0A7W2R2W0_9FLAO|nr:hypothetical protein [Gelidibacter maritimus]MBA6152008.1 hypothetical protein [Gelidibacter maritimus]
MKIKLLMTATVVLMVMTSQLYAQKTSKQKVEQKVKVEKTKKAKTMEEMKVIPRSKAKVTPIKERVKHGRIDPITGEQVITPTTEAVYVAITSPKSNLSVGEGLNGKITVKGRTNKRQWIEIRVQSGKRTVDNYTDTNRYYSKVIEDWRPVKANADGNWHTMIDVKPLSYSAGADYDNVEQHYFTILVRSRNDKSKIDILHLQRFDN